MASNQLAIDLMPSVTATITIVEDVPDFKPHNLHHIQASNFKTQALVRIEHRIRQSSELVYMTFTLELAGDAWVTPRSWQTWRDDRRNVTQTQSDRLTAARIMLLEDEALLEVARDNLNPLRCAARADARAQMLAKVRLLREQAHTWKLLADEVYPDWEPDSEGVKP